MNRISLNKMELHDANKGFSLIEVIIAIGVAAFALIAIFGLFASSLRTSKDSSAQQEGFEVERILPTWFLTTNFTSSNTLGAMATNLWKSPTNTTNYFILTSNNSGLLTTVVYSRAPSNYITSTNYAGTLYFALISASSNAPSAIFPTTSVKGGALQPTWTNWPALPVHATVYSIPSPNATNIITKSAPVISFDFMIFR